MRVTTEGIGINRKIDGHVARRQYLGAENGARDPGKQATEWRGTKLEAGCTEKTMEFAENWQSMVQSIHSARPRLTSEVRRCSCSATIIAKRLGG